jgi:hypothetical protein
VRKTRSSACAARDCLLQRQDLLYGQLRALYRAAQHGPLWIMFPMVTHISEIEALRGHCELAREQVKGPDVKLGIMVEIPAVAVMADRFAPLVDFFSIGTNDLTQYALAVDRQHPELAAQADSLHPAVLNLIDATVRGAQAASRARDRRRLGRRVRWLAGDPLGARILTGLGVDELSMSAQDIAAGESRATRRIAHRHAGTGSPCVARPHRRRGPRPMNPLQPLNPFAESPQVVTVALNPALDQTIEVAGITLGAVNRALRMQVDVGGKAVNVASCLSDFGVSARRSPARSAAITPRCSRSCSNAKRSPTIAAIWTA